MSRVVIVTGAGSGIGAATSVRLAREGWVVVCADRDLEAARATVDGLRPDAYAAFVDVTDDDAVRELVAFAVRVGDLAALVNAAGIGSTTNIVRTSVSEWDDVMAVNARGTFLSCKHAVPLLAARGEGAIVNIASVAGLVGLRDRAAYCASKGAVIALTRALAIDHAADGVRINSVCPGTIATPWVSRLVADAGASLDELTARQPMGRLGTADEVAGTVAWLLGPDATFATGASIVLDGGLTAG